ncbi:hypothetical protein AAVH_32199 [Aphelenchoides avenae]|nr:hypothetical protein AAVH_32199 [Aphelenchus avenae]
MSEGSRHGDVADDQQATSSQAPADDLNSVIRALECMHADASKLRRELSCGAQLRSKVMADSKTNITWYSYAERLRVDQPDLGCRLLVENLHAALGNLLATLPKEKEVRPCIPLNNVLVDIFMCLDRVSLDAVQLTHARFNALVKNYLKNACYRIFTVVITNLEHAPHFRRYQGQPVNYAAPGVYSIKIEAHHDAITKYRSFIYESHSLEELFSKWAEKMPDPAFVQSLGLDCVPNVLGQFTELHRSLAERTIIDGLWVFTYAGELIRVIPLLDNLNAFRAVRSIAFTGGLQLDNTAAIFKRCREMGICELEFVGQGHVEVSVDALLDFCIGPTHEGLESATRRVFGATILDRELPHRLIEAVAKHGKPGTDIDVQMFAEHADFDRQALEAQVRKHYARLQMASRCFVGEDEVGYLAQPLEGVDVAWYFCRPYVRVTVLYK